MKMTTAKIQSKQFILLSKIKTAKLDLQLWDLSSFIKLKQTKQSYHDAAQAHHAFYLNISQAFLSKWVPAAASSEASC